MFGNRITYTALALSYLSCLSIILYPLSLMMANNFFNTEQYKNASFYEWLFIILLLTYPITTIAGLIVAMKGHSITKNLDTIKGMFISYSNFIFIIILMLIELKNA
ncbi:hypothetical protein GCM10007922_07850 [Shewanella decolorationis]|nr:hypothetical protein GCM10007922_07850 [Shewanella decolorationis]